jgi:DNA-directed RNA polymerase subunit H
MVSSVKKQRMGMLEGLLKEDLEKIAKIEGISTEGSKEELINRLSNRLNLLKTKNYAKKLTLQQIFNIFDHELVPKHRVLPDKERDELLQKYGITAKQLPRISMNDPAILAIDAKPGDVIEISRESAVAGQSKYYRTISKPKK